MRSLSLGIAGTVLVVSAGCGETTAPATSFTATLRDASEVPPVVTGATGTATLTVSGANITYTVTVAGLSGPATASHVHVAAAGANGPVRLNLCGTSGTPGCASLTTGQLVSGTATATNLVGISMTELLEQMGNFGAYVNVHTARNTGGEIRGQIIGSQ